MPFSGPNLFAGLLFSSIGFVGFVYGKRMRAWKSMFLGIALMAYPYFIEDTITILRRSGWPEPPRSSGLAISPRRSGSLCFRVGLRPAR